MGHEDITRTQKMLLRGNTRCGWLRFSKEKKLEVGKIDLESVEGLVRQFR